MPHRNVKEVMIVFENGKTEHFIAPDDIIIASDVDTYVGDDPTHKVFYWSVTIAPKRS